MNVVSGQQLLGPIYRALGKVWRFQLVKIPHQKGKKRPHRESTLGPVEATT
jgi:hypothetical protein